MSFQYATGMCLLLENVGGSEQNRSVIANVQSACTPSNLKIGHYLAKLWTKIWCLVFYWTTVYIDHPKGFINLRHYTTFM